MVPKNFKLTLVNSLTKSEGMVFWLNKHFSRPGKGIWLTSILLNKTEIQLNLMGWREG